MNKKVFVVVVGVAMAFAMAGGLIASNMGFKLNYPLAASGAGSNSGTNTIALPFNRQSGINTASALQNDIGGTAVVTNVQKFLEDTDGLQVYTGVKGSGPDFNLAAGEGYFVRMSAPVDYIVVGSHDPTLSVSLDASGAASNSGTNFFAYPYHSTAATASQLQNDIGGTAVVTNVQKFLEDTDGLQVYTGVKGSGPDFNLVPGEAYFVRMSSTVNYTPSHY